MKNFKISSYNTNLYKNNHPENRNSNNKFNLMR